jgi:hypothetical protein
MDMSTIKAIFSDKRTAAVEKLWADQDTRKLLLQQVAIELPDYGAVIWRYPREQVLALAAQATFAGMDEAFCVGAIINKHMRETQDLLPMVTQHHGWELASRCLVSLGFFEPYMQRRSERYNAPSPDFYRARGKEAFRNEGWDSIARNFDQWIAFLSDTFSESNS